MSAIKVSNADRVVFPEAGVTKGEVVAFYERIAPRALPHVAGRPLSIQRFPKGLAEKGFFQKNVPKHYPSSITRLSVPRASSDEPTIYPVLSEEAHLPYVGNQGAIELHVTTARADDLGHPDRLVVDLDPPAGATAAVRRAALVVREQLGELGLRSVPVATGSKGYHVVAPIRPTVSAMDLATTAHKLATLLAHAHGDELTVAFRIALRGQRVFVDWLRNLPSASVVAPYSLRARPRATVAVPLAWEELDVVAPDTFTLRDVEALLDRPDPLLERASAPDDPLPFVAAVDAAFARANLVLERFDRFRS